MKKNKKVIVDVLRCADVNVAVVSTLPYRTAIIKSISWYYITD